MRKTHILLGITNKSDRRNIDLRTVDVIDQTMIDDKLTPVLRQDDAPNLDAMKSHAKKILDQILSRTEKEKEFLHTFLENGEYKPELLFETGQAQRLMNHPAVLWKLHNLRKFKGLDKDVN